MKKTILFLSLCLLTNVAFTQQNDPLNKLNSFDADIDKMLKDWNVPGCGVGIVYKGKLVFAKGYGYRNLEKKLPVTPNTLFQIASNTKLFTATAIGFLVEKGKLDWDKPIKKYVPQIQFYNDNLDANVTIRDMLSHRTGISRHDGIWFKSDFTRQELFDRVKYLEPSLPLRQGYLYNNLMYMASGQIVEILSGKTWEKYVEEKIFTPLNMTNSSYDSEVAAKTADFMAPYYEKRDTNILLPYPIYTQQQGIGPAGSIISNINDLSNWLIAQMNSGKFKDKQVIPNSIIKETMQPASLTGSVPDKYFENLNSIYGMGRGSSAYKGHYRIGHTGAIGGIYSSISFMPADSIGIIVFSNGDHAGGIPTLISNIIYDKVLNLGETPWSERALQNYLKSKQTAKEARQKPDVDRVLDTKPSHALADYVGIYEDAAYGKMEIALKNNLLHFTFNNTTLPLSHYHYDRFESADDEINGKETLVFGLDAQGSVQQIKVSMDQKEVAFTKMADAKLTDPSFLKTLEGQYELNGNTMEIVLNNTELVIKTAPPLHLEPYKNNIFKIHEFSDRTVEFVFDATSLVTGFKLTSNGKSFLYTKKK